MSKKPMIIVGVLFSLIIIALTVYLVLSLTTDMFKSKSEIFQKHFFSGIDKTENVLEFSKENEYINTLIQKNYKDNTKINIKYLNSNNENEVFNIICNGITNNANSNSFKRVLINYGDTELMNLEYLRENKNIGLLFTDVVKQFLSIDTEKAEDFLKYIGYNGNLTLDSKIKKIWDISKDKKEDIKNIVIKTVKQIDSKSIIKSKASQITLNNGEEKIVSSYSVVLSKDEVKEILLDIFDLFDNQEGITLINKNEIIIPEATINLYIENNSLLRIETEIDNNQIYLDFFENELNFKYRAISNESIDTYYFDIKKQDEDIYMRYEDSNRNNINLKYRINKEANNLNSKIQISYKNDFIKEINFNVEQILEISDNTIEGIEKKYENIDSFNLSELKENEKNSALIGLLKKIDTLISNKNNQFNSQILNIILQGNKKMQTQIQNRKESLKKNFNNQFLPYQGQNIEKEVIYNLLDLAGRNMEKYLITGEDKYRIYIAEEKKNVKLAEELKEKIEKSDKDFSISFEYDSEGRVNVIRIQGFKKIN